MVRYGSSQVARFRDFGPRFPWTVESHRAATCRLATERCMRMACGEVLRPRSSRAAMRPSSRARDRIGLPNHRRARGTVELGVSHRATVGAGPGFVFAARGA